MRPYHLLLFLLLVFGLAIGLAAIWPKEGLPLTREWRLKYASLDDLFGQDTTRTVDVNELLSGYELSFDSTAIKDSLRLAEITFRRKMMRIQYADSTSKLTRFFQALDQRKQGIGKVRILHYGDSQIEGDRITSDIRNGLQKTFGGSGPGYTSAHPLAESMSLTNKRSANWRRYPVFGNQDTTLTHNRFGMYGEFSRFTPFPLPDSLRQSPADSITHAWIELSPTNISYRTARTFTKMTILFRNPDARFKLRVVLSDSTETRREFAANPNAQEYHQTFVSAPASVRLEFEAKSSPDIYGIRLENESGVAMDNIAMRGSSGTFFGQINNAEMATQFANANPDLIILQFGGNTVPYMTEYKVAQYGGWFTSQIRYLRRMNPNADFVVIGPSDMSMKEETRYVTFPILPRIRDMLRTVALDNGAGYWDMYEVMGGRNSMPSWVAADPPLAAPDYVHFSRQGAQKIAQLFYDALMKDYEEWKSGE